MNRPNGQQFAIIGKRLTQSGVWELNANFAKMWVWLLIEAEHPDRDEYGGKIKVPAGSVLASYKQLSFALRQRKGRGFAQPTGPVLDTMLRTLKAMGNITTKQTSYGLLITLCNWAVWHNQELDVGVVGDEQTDGWKYVENDGLTDGNTEDISLDSLDSKPSLPHTSEASSKHPYPNGDGGQRDGNGQSDIPPEATALAAHIEHDLGVMLNTQTHHVGRLHRQFRGQGKMSDEWIYDVVLEARESIASKSRKWDYIFAILRDRLHPKDENSVPSAVPAQAPPGMKACRMCGQIGELTTATLRGGKPEPAVRCKQCKALVTVRSPH